MEPNSLNQTPTPTSEPSFFQPNETPSPTALAAPAAQLQAVVDYMPNVTVFGSKTVLLEWGADNRIRLYEMNFDTNQATGVMFDAALTDIKKVTGSINMLTFHIGDKAYRTLFARMATAGIGAVGVGIALKELNDSGAKLWINKLKQNGIKVRLLGWGASFAIAIGIVVVIAVIVIAVQIANGEF
ncbi:MAG TPA: hypothetical protein VIM31_04395 [Candidatus Microsaccharimonas sp.]|jgi:hypothetical protein